MAAKVTTWLRLSCESKELQLKGTLNGGQSFRWKQVKTGEWLGVFNSKLWILKENENGLDFQVHTQESSESTNKKQKLSEDTFIDMLKNYFQLNLNLSEHYTQWSQADPLFKSVANDFYGIRMLYQEVVENIFSFICSSNNNISRITSMVEKLAKFYGEFICEYNGESFYSFPKVEDLTVDGVEENLRKNGFGYRAKYIANTAKIICDNGGLKWLEALKNKPYKEAKAQLTTLTGVGPKVADCICLMSLGHLGAIPVDTHVYQIAAKHYIPNLAKQKTVTDKMYNQIGEHFRELYGPMAGWAQTVLFCADLKKFQAKAS